MTDAGPEELASTQSMTFIPAGDSVRYRKEIVATRSTDSEGWKVSIRVGVAEVSPHDVRGLVSEFELNGSDVSAELDANGDAKLTATVAPERPILIHGEESPRTLKAGDLRADTADEFREHLSEDEEQLSRIVEPRHEPSSP